MLQQYRDFIAKAPDELAVWPVIRAAPPLPFLDRKFHGTNIVALAVFYAGKPEQGLPLIEPVRKFGTLLGEHVGAQPFVAWQQAFDPLLTTGARNYWKSHNFTTLKDGLFDTVIDSIKISPSPHSEIFIGALGGATARPSPTATAYAHRHAQFVMNVHGRWMTAAEDEAGIRWARDFFKASAPYAAAGAYGNFLTADEDHRARSVYGPNYDRLSQIKRQYDPENLFRVNQNIEPA